MLRMPTWTRRAPASTIRRPTHAWLCGVPSYVSRRSVWASNCRPVRSPYRSRSAPTAPTVPECSPPSSTGTFPARTVAFTRRSTSFRAGTGPARETGTSVETKIPARYGSILFSSSNSSMWEEASRMARGPLRVPVMYVVVMSTGNGITTKVAAFHDAYLPDIPPKVTEYGITLKTSSGAVGVRRAVRQILPRRRSPAQYRRPGRPRVPQQELQRSRAAVDVLLDGEEQVRPARIGGRDPGPAERLAGKAPAVLL